MNRISLLLLLSLVVTSAPTPACARDADVVTLTVLSTNDFHGSVDGIEDPELAGKGRVLGGLDRLAGLVARLRAGAPGPVLLVDAGDCFQGGLAVNQGEGSSCVKMFNLLGYAAVTLGNHEFDYLDVGPDAADLPPKDPQGALKKALGAATYPIVVANLRDSKTGRTPDWPGLKPYVVVDTGGIKVGITGVLTPDVAMVTNPGATAGLDVIDPVTAVREWLPKMRAEGAGVVVVLAHLTGSCHGAEGGKGGLGACRVSGDLGRLASAFNPGEVDLIAAGHSHVSIAGAKQAVPVMEAAAQGRFVGHAEIRVDRASGRAVAGGVRVLAPVPICRVEDPDSRVCAPSWAGYSGVAEPGAEAAKLLAEIDGAIAGVCNEVVATLPRDILHGLGPETPLADLTADLMRAADSVEAGGTGPGEVAFTNMGSIRDSLRAGPLTVCDLHRVWPFEDPLIEVTMTGAELTEAMRFVVVNVRKVFATSGLIIERGGGSLVLKDPSGNPLDPARRYRVVTTSYLVRGGDKLDTVMSRLPADRFRTLSYPAYRDAFRALLKARGTVEPPEGGRIR